MMIDDDDDRGVIMMIDDDDDRVVIMMILMVVDGFVSSASKAIQWHLNHSLLKCFIKTKQQYR